MATTGAQDAGAHLRALLVTTTRYRAHWLRFSARTRGELNQAAVAAVLSGYLWDSGLVPDVDVDLPRRLKDRVSRALLGRGLGPDLLRTFIEAFEMSDMDAQDLWQLLLRPASPGLVVVRQAPAVATRAVAPATWRTLSIHEFHRVGRDGLPVDHRTVQVIRATDAMTKYCYRFDTSAAVVDVVRGGRAEEVYATKTPGVFAVDISLTRALVRGDTASLEYRTVFAYIRAPEPVFRRVSVGRTENVELNLCFDACALPRQVWCCVWESATASVPISRDPVALDSDHQVHRYFQAVESAGVGFSWVW